MASRDFFILANFKYVLPATKWPLSLVIATLCMVISVGCSKSSNSTDQVATSSQGKETSNAEPTSTPSIDQVANGNTKTVATNVSHVKDISESQQPTGFQLSGIWYGESRLDVDAANAKLSNLTEAETQRLQSIINAFGSIVMAAEFRADGVLELDMMIAGQDGTPLRDRSIGTWKTLEAGPTAIKIETSEYSGEETEPKTKIYIYKILGNDHFEFVPESIHPELFTLSPRIVFQRVKQPLEDASIAEKRSGNSLRR